MTTDREAEPAPVPAADRPITTVWVNGAAYLLGVLVLFLADEVLKNEYTVACLALIAAAVPMAAYDLLVAKVHRRPSAGLLITRGAYNWPRIGAKLLAFYATIGVLCAVYAVLPVYEAGRFAAFFVLAQQVLPAVLVLAVPWTMLIDQRMAAPRDGAFHMGQVLLGRFADRDWNAVRTYVLAWIVKGFFLPIMVAGFLMISDKLISARFEFFLLSVPNFYFFLFDIILFMDLTVAVLGYLLTTRALDAHIRSVNPIAWGWLVTLACYYPFWGMLYSNVVGYDDGTNWVGWLGGTGPLLIAWAAVLLALKCTWLWANITFGLRFSNLTHRGILTHGPFRFTKHPSYVSKNLAWWMISMPFLSVAGWEAAALNSLGLLAVNAIYFLRARAEERHLSEDPVYVAYAEAMNERGLFRWISAAVPWLAYRAPRVTSAVYPTGYTA